MTNHGTITIGSETFPVQDIDIYLGQFRGDPQNDKLAFFEQFAINGKPVPHPALIEDLWNDRMQTLNGWMEDDHGFIVAMNYWDGQFHLTLYWNRPFDPYLERTVKPGTPIRVQTIQPG